MLLWKFSEAFSTNKLQGIPCWTQPALQSLRTYGTAMTAGELKKRGEQQDQGLVHEHVFPRATLADWLLDGVAPGIRDGAQCDRDGLQQLLARLCVGCVVTKNEDDKLKLVAFEERDRENPWSRYQRAAIATSVVVRPPEDTDADERLSDNVILRLHSRLLQAALTPS